MMEERPSQTTEGPAYGGINAARSVKPDTLNSEFLYYSSVLRILAPALSNDLEKQRIIPWIKKLFRPEYHSTQFRDKRNRYLLFLTISLLNDEAFGLFRTVPPEGALVEINELEPPELPAAEWEMDTVWAETVASVPDFKMLECSVHQNRQECANDHHLDKVLDQEFQFLLYLARPFAVMLVNPDDKTRVASWLQLLCTIQGTMCSSMRGIRNDYMMALLGFLSNLRVVGPFNEYPPWRTLKPLAEAAKLLAEKPITDPTCKEADEFLHDQPVPDDGAFCYIAITGDLISSNFSPIV